MSKVQRSAVRSGKGKCVDPLETAIETVLAPGQFISYDAAWPFVDNVSDVAVDIGNIIHKEPERATRLYEIFIAACHEKADEIDDSDGDFGMLVEELFSDWIKARQADNGDPDETAMFLLSWMEDDPCGFCYGLVRDAAKVLDKKGLDAFVQQIRTKFESSLTQDGKEKHFPGYACRRWGGALKTLLAAQRNVNAYIALCDQTELEAKDCMAIAKIYKSRRRHEEALSWVERGLKIAQTDSRKSYEEYELCEIKRALTAKLGRPGDALQSAWSEFESYPSKITYYDTEFGLGA